MELDQDRTLNNIEPLCRKQAEARWADKKIGPSSADPCKEEVLALVHELEVHQIELEMQNDALAQARDSVEQALRQYTELYDFAPLSYVTLDRRAGIQAVNLAAADLLGIERERLFGQRFTLFMAEGNHGRFTAFLDKVFSSRVKESCELTILARDRVLRIVQIEAIATTSGKKCCLAIIDNTERKRIESALLESERFYRAIGESVNYGVWISDREGRNIYASESFLRLLGMTQKQYSNCTLAEVLHPDQVEFVRSAWQACVGSENDMDLELLFRGADGQWHPILTRGVPVRNEQGAVSCWAGINLDISGIKRTEEAILRQSLALQKVSTALQLEIGERIRAEEELLQAHDGLELKIKSRTAELSEANEKLTVEIGERRQAEGLLRSAYVQIKELKERLQAENVYLQKEVDLQFNRGEIVGQSKGLAQVFFRIQQVAALSTTVLLLGETGSGKGVVARAIHSRSARKDRPLITVNCATLPANLVESELFGREKGAFTGADSAQVGRFELANGGTIFLDELGELPLELQCKLLRVLQDGEFERLGSSRTIKVDVRIIAATNRNLEEEILAGKFRRDLYYRLNVFPISIPPLRQRKGDIPLLVNHFVNKFNHKIGKRIDFVATPTMNMLEKYFWPGNVRELESVVERAVIISQGNALQVLDHFDSFSQVEPAKAPEPRALAELECNHLLLTLKKTSWRIEGENGAALILGLNPSTLRARMRKYGISRKGEEARVEALLQVGQDA